MNAQATTRDAPPLLSSLAALARLRGRPVSLQRLIAGLPGGSADPAACLRSASAAGLAGRVLSRPTPADILPSALPCILLLAPDTLGRPRSCVLTALDREKNEAECVFPESEPDALRLSLPELQTDYAGLAIFASVRHRLAERFENVPLLKGRRWFADVLLHYLPLYRDVGLASLTLNLLSLAGPLFLMNVYDRVVPNNALDTLWVLACGLFVAYCADLLLRVLRGRYVDLAGRNADVVLNARLMDKILNMRLDAKPDSTGGLVDNLREFEQVREFFGSTTLLALVDLPFLLLFIALVAYLGGPIALLPLLGLPLMLAFARAVQVPFQRSIERRFKHGMRKNALLTEIVAGIENVKGCLAQGHMRRLWEECVDDAAAEGAKSRGYAIAASSGSLFITHLVSAGVIIWGVYRISDGLMTQGGLIACVILAGRAMGPIMQLAAMFTQLQKSRIALRALDLLMELPDERPEQAAGADPGRLAPSFGLRGVRFSYPGAPAPALNDCTLQIRPGEHVGVIGPTGCGKSTLARLLIGLYEPAEGSVSFGGLDIRQMDCADLRSRIGFLPQDSYLFHGSVRENIAMGSPLADERLILRAAALAGVTDFVRAHPRGFNMEVGERGLALSGGQRQAVALARALARDPAALILDEPSSNMDMQSEQMLMKRLAPVLKGRTLVLMTHRPALLALVDRLLVLHEGRVLADGPRDAVLRALENGSLRPTQTGQTGQTGPAQKEGAHA